MYGPKMNKPKPFDAKKAVEAEYRRSGHKPKRKLSISQKWAREAKIKKPLPTEQELIAARMIAEKLIKG